VQQSASVEDASRSVEFRCPTPGTVIEYNTGAVLTFSTGSGFVCSYSDTTGNRAKYAGFGDDAALLRVGLDRLWPLAMGAHQEMTASPGSASSASVGGVVERFTVLRREVVAVPAGTFYAVVVEQDEGTSGGIQAQEAKRLFWWAPELGLVVKSTYQLVRDARWAQSVPTTIVPGDYMAVRISAPGQVPAGPVQSAAVPAPATPPAPPAAAAVAPLPAANTAPAPAPSSTSLPVETIRFEQRGGVFLLPVQINGRITLDFILDSGSADVSVPADVVLTLIRTGTVSDRDFTGTRTYVMADGSKLPGQTFTLHELRIGDHVIRNVAASVAPVQARPLLGQSFLSKLPTWTIDNKQHALIIGQ